MSNDTDRAPAACPHWCRSDHSGPGDVSEYVSADGFVVYRERHHERDVDRVVNPGAGPDKEAVVWIGATDDLDQGVRLPALINVDGAEYMTPDTAMEVAVALVRACGAVTGGSA